MQNKGWDSVETRRFSFGKAMECFRGFSERQVAWWKNHPNLLCFLVLAAVLAIMFCRTPSIFFRPRLWAEEGAAYYSNAYKYAHTTQWYRGITHTVMLVGGYVHLWTGLAVTTAANCVSEEYAPNVTLVFALIAQLIPFAIVLWSRSSFWQSSGRKALGVLILLFAPISGEAWVNTLQSQVHFSIATLLLLIEEAPATTVRRWMYRVLLVLAGLSGPISCILAPVFFVEAYCEKRKERIIQAAILAACAVTQVILIKCFGPNRASSESLTIFGLTLGTQCFGPILFGFHNMSVFSTRLIQYAKQGGFGVSLTAFLFFSIVVLLLAVLSKGVSPKERRIFLGAFFILTFASVCGAVGEKWEMIYTSFGQRYFLTPNIAILLLFLAGIRGVSRLGSKLATGMLVIALMWGVVDYRRTAFYYNGWPSWKTEVQAWRENPQHKPGIWPGGWTCELDRTIRR